MAARLGRTPAELVGRRCFEVVHGLDHPPEGCPQLALLEDGEAHTAEVVEPRLGGVFTVTTFPRADLIGRVVGSVHVAHDVTAQRRAEDELRASEQRLFMALESARIGVFDWDVASGKVLYVSWATQGVDESPRYQVTDASSWSGLVCPEDLDAAQAETERALAGQTDVFTTVVQRRAEADRSGRLYHVRSRGRVVARDAGGRATRVVGTFEDITEEIRRERLERVRTEARSRLAGLTRREREVAELVADGLTSPEMAARLGLSVRTVEMHRARLRRRIGAATTADVVGLVLRGRGAG
jgi:DNA-binding CsgD family transcriptional regulator/PAS domain-containing protein